MDAPPDVIIIGAGIVGLVFAHALKARSITFGIYERDLGPFHRKEGWALYLHWCLPILRDLLPQQLFDSLQKHTVDPDATAEGENGRLPFFDLSTGQEKFHVTLRVERLRLLRKTLRNLLMTGINIQWGKRLETISTSTSPQRITAHFQDGTSVSGRHLVGCDGSHSRVRELLCAPHVRSRNYTLPVRLLGATVLLPLSIGQQMKTRDPFCFQGGHPNGSFFFFSILDTPAHNDRTDDDKEKFCCQIIVSWPFRQGFLGRTKETEVPDSNEDRLRLLKDITNGWFGTFGTVVQRIPEGTPIQQIKVEDWLPNKGSWNNHDGMATLFGDAAHAMTMCMLLKLLGNAVNYGILDIKTWFDHFLEHLNGEGGLKEPCKAYEQRMIERSIPAVLESRKACENAHTGKIDEQSPLVNREVVTGE